MLEETKKIYDCFFDSNEKEEVENIIKELEKTIIVQINYGNLIEQ